MRPIAQTHYVWHKGKIIKPIAILPKGVIIRTNHTALVSGEKMREIVRWHRLEEFDSTKWRNTLSWAWQVHCATYQHSGGANAYWLHRVQCIKQGLDFVYDRYNITQYIHGT